MGILGFYENVHDVFDLARLLPPPSRKNEYHHDSTETPGTYPTRRDLYVSP